MKKKGKTATAHSDILRQLRTLVVDDASLLSCVRQLLDTQALVQAVGTAAGGVKALHKAAALTPDLMVMDLHIPCIDGLQATVLLRRRQHDTHMIIMTLDEKNGTKAAAWAHGAHSSVGKSRIATDLVTEIRRVFRLNHAADEQSL